MARHKPRPGDPFFTVNRIRKATRTTNMTSVRDLTMLADRMNRVIDEAGSVEMCADFIRKHRATDCVDIDAWVKEHDRLVLQLLEAQTRLSLAIAKIK